MTRAASDAGFTLIEALVAMAVLAVGAVALLTATETHSRRIGDVIDRSAARWAATYRLAELRLGVAPSDGPVESFGRVWVVAEEYAETDDPELASVTVTAAPEGGTPLVRLTGYVERDPGGASP